ncbi:hypothetical protein F4861DRAFT_187184 [Xylaria intraflava]|nr:hypothetical protein F4861DRAFT_187184 [Xylaria intraflava]
MALLAWPQLRLIHSVVVLTSVLCCLIRVGRRFCLIRHLYCPESLGHPSKTRPTITGGRLHLIHAHRSNPECIVTLRRIRRGLRDLKRPEIKRTAKLFQGMRYYSRTKCARHEDLRQVFFPKRKNGSENSSYKIIFAHSPKLHFTYCGVYITYTSVSEILSALC